MQTTQIVARASARVFSSHTRNCDQVFDVYISKNTNVSTASDVAALACRSELGAVSRRWWFLSLSAAIAPPEWDEFGYDQLNHPGLIPGSPRFGNQFCLLELFLLLATILCVSHATLGYGTILTLVS